MEDSGRPELPLYQTSLLPDIGQGAVLGKTSKSTRYVVSASKKTDIPAFYLPWFASRVECGFVEVPNSRFRHKTYRVSLVPEDVAGVVWWSKNYSVYLRDRFYRQFERYDRQFFHLTANSRRPDLAWLEPDVPDESDIVVQFRRLASLRGPEAIAWRNDPISFWNEGGAPRSSWDPEFFRRMCDALGDVGMSSIFVSIADPYLKFRRRMTRLYPDRALREPSGEELATIAGSMTAIARPCGLRVQSCAEPLLENYHGVTHGACIDHQFFGSSRSAASDRTMKGREFCGCSVHRDIGDYVTQECGYSCIYCYANPNHRRFAAGQPQPE